MEGDAEEDKYRATHAPEPDARGGATARSRMDARLALADASASGLLQAMAQDCTPRTAGEWAARSQSPMRRTEAVLCALADVHVVDEVGADGRYVVPEDRAGTVCEMGAVFEALLGPRFKADTAATLILVKFRCDKILGRAGGDAPVGEVVRR